MSDWQYSMTLAQIYSGRITVTKISVPQMPKCHRIPELKNKVTDQFVKLQQSYKSNCKITPICYFNHILPKTHKCSRTDTQCPLLLPAAWPVRVHLFCSLYLPPHYHLEI